MAVGSIPKTLWLASSVTHTEPPPTAIPPPAALVRMTFFTLPVAASMRVTVRSSAFVTQTEPKPYATAVGPAPTGIGSPTTAFDCGLIQLTVSSSWLATQTPPPPTAIPLGPAPTGIVCTAPVDGSIRDTVSAFASAAQTTPSLPTATAVGACSTVTWLVTRPLWPSMKPTELAATTAA